MKRRCYIFLAAMALLLFVYFYIGFQYNNYKYQLYFTHFNEQGLFKWLGIVPNEYGDTFDEKVVESSIKYDLKVIENKRSPLRSSDVLLHDKTLNENIFLRANPTSLLGISEVEMGEITCENQISYYIDIEAFNRYAQLLEIKNKMEIIEKYLLIQSLGFDNDFSRRIKSNKDLLDLQSLLERNECSSVVDHNREMGCKFIDLIKLDINPDQNIAYYWYKDHGVVEFNFHFTQVNGSIELLKVDSERLGVIGIEINLCC